MYMPLICPKYGGYLPFTSLLREVSGLLYSTSTEECGAAPVLSIRMVSDPLNLTLPFVGGVT